MRYSALDGGTGGFVSGFRPYPGFGLGNAGRNQRAGGAPGPPAAVSEAPDPLELRHGAAVVFVVVGALRLATQPADGGVHCPANGGVPGNEAATALRRNRSTQRAGFDTWSGDVNFANVIAGDLRRLRALFGVGRGCPGRAGSCGGGRLRNDGAG